MNFQIFQRTIKVFIITYSCTKTAIPRFKGKIHNVNLFCIVLLLRMCFKLQFKNFHYKNIFTNALLWVSSYFIHWKGYNLYSSCVCMNNHIFIFGGKMNKKKKDIQ